MINNNKTYHASNLYEENLQRSSKKPGNRGSNQKLRKNENSLTEPSPYEDSEKIYKFRNVPSSTPLEKPNKDCNRVAEFTKPTENPAYFLKELIFFFLFFNEMHDSF